MELYKIIKHFDNCSTYVLKITGNSRLRILNDYDMGLIDEKYIKYKNKELFLEVSNPNTNMFVIDGFDEQLVNKMSYIKFIYKKEQRPCISLIWDYSEFTPFNIIYPVCKLTKETCEKFGIATQTYMKPNRN